MQKCQIRIDIEIMVIAPLQRLQLRLKCNFWTIDIDHLKAAPVANDIGIDSEYFGGTS